MIDRPPIRGVYLWWDCMIKGAHRDFSTTSHSAQFHTQVKLQHRRLTLIKLQRSAFAASMQKQLPKLTAD